MVAPITGPFITEIGGSGPDNQGTYSRKIVWKQKRPFTVALPYESNYGRVQSITGNPPYGARRFGTQGTLEGVYNWSDLTGKSYDKLKGRMSDSAALAVSLVEGRQSLSMVTARAGQLLSFGRRLSRGDLVGAAKVLKLSAVPKRASVKRSFAGNWLEYYFGWVPLIGDIYSTIDVLQSPLKSQWVKGGAKSGPFGYANLQTPYEYSNPGAFNNVSYQKFYERLKVTQAGMSQGCGVAVSNPNLWLANQLGFVNPATVAWELIPFSFVVDWFVNVEQFLSTGTDFYGLTVENPWNVRHLKVTYEYYNEVKYRWWISGTYWPNDLYYYTTSRDSLVNQGVHTIRSQGLASPTLYVRPLKLPSWKRALTAVSLLVQQLSKR